MSLLRKYIRGLLNEENVLAAGMCFPFAYQKAEEWFETYYTKGRPGRSAKKHPDLNNKDKFKVVHGTVTNKWKSPPKPVVHGWVEMGDLVFDDQTKVTKPNGIDKEVYYDMYQPEAYKEFTAEEAILNCAMKGGEGPWDNDLIAQLQQRDEWLQEKAQRGKGKNKRTLYHINKRPATPQPKVKMLQDWDPKAIDRDTGEKTGDMVNIPGTDNWQRHWLDSPVKSGVFLTPNPVDIAMNHGRSGNVYAYKVPEWVIDESGGLHRYDHGSEVLIPEDIWNEAGDEIEFLGKSMDQNQLWDKAGSSDYGRGHTRKAKKPSWMSDEELKKWEARKTVFNLPALRSTKHPESAIKMMKPDEVKNALKAFEKEYEEKPAEIIPPSPGDRKGIKIPHFGHKPSLQDQKLIDMLKKRQNESLIREYIQARLLVEEDQEAQENPGLVEFIIQSNQIEGYELDPEEVKEAVDGHLAGYPPTYVTQNPHIYSHLAGIEAAKGGYSSVGDITRIHAAMGAGALDAGAPGVLRSGVEAQSAGGTKYVSSEDVPAALSWWAGQGWGSPFEAHTVYELIHPFADGNGRSGRIIMAAMTGFNYDAVNGMIGGGYFGGLDSMGEKYQGEFWKE